MTVMAHARSEKAANNLMWSGRQHLLDTKDLSKDEITYLMHRAKYFKEQIFVTPSADKLHALKSILFGKVLANVFYENSTRTRLSFELAGKHLGMDVLNLDIGRSSVQKGESLEDTARTLVAQGACAIIQRHIQPGSAAQIAAVVGKGVHIINAGEGITAHPTQGLLDLFTMLEQCPSDGKKDLSTSKIVIVGDIAHSRVARSIMCLAPLFGFAVHLVGPKEWLPEQKELAPIAAKVHHDLNEAIVDADFVMVLRVQLERMDTAFDSGKYVSSYQITHERLKSAKPSVKVMHPGPINRGVEISANIANDQAISLIECQVRNGVPIRMAVLEALCSADQ